MARKYSKRKNRKPYRYFGASNVFGRDGKRKNHNEYMRCARCDKFTYREELTHDQGLCLTCACDVDTDYQTYAFRYYDKHGSSDQLTNNGWFYNDGDIPHKEMGIVTLSQSQNRRWNLNDDVC